MKIVSGEKMVKYFSLIKVISCDKKEIAVDYSKRDIWKIWKRTIKLMVT